MADLPLKSPVYANILNQADALEQVLDYQLTHGQAALAPAARALVNASRLVVVASGASYSACTAFVYRLAAAGVASVQEEGGEFLHYTARGYPVRSVFVFVSRSGESVEIVRALEALKRPGHITIGVTNEPGSRLARECDLPVLIHGPSDHQICIQTYATTLLTLYLLAMAVIGVPSSEYAPGLAQMVQAVRSTLAEYQERSAAWAEQLRAYQAIYLLGRGLSYASAQQGAHVLHEMARFPGIAYSSGAFRHGPWEAVDENSRAVVFAPTDHTLPLNLALAGDLVRLGGEVALVTSNKGPLPAGVEAWRVPAIEPALAPFLEILPVEFLAYQLALWRGLTPGAYRASRQVTTSETGIWPEASE
ncbi:MAG: SIS domain-containing protein [Chloroflexota bacterium]